MSSAKASLFSFLPTDINYWIGLTNLANEGVFVWQTDFTEADYTNWREGEPNGDEGAGDCVHLVKQSIVHKLGM